MRAVPGPRCFATRVCSLRFTYGRRIGNLHGRFRLVKDLKPDSSDRVPFAGSNSQQHCSTAPNPARPISPADIRIRFSTDEKKPVFSDRFLKMVGERGLHCSSSSALRAVAEATLSRYARLKPPSEVLILFSTDEKKPVFSDRFQKWSAREDSNLRPTGPKPVALPSCATRRFF